MQLRGSLSILWHCLSLGLEWKLIFSSPVAPAEFSKFAGILSAALSQHHLPGFEIAQLWPWSMEWSRAKANRVLPRERTGHSKHPLPATQEKALHMDITRWRDVGGKIIRMVMNWTCRMREREDPKRSKTLWLSQLAKCHYLQKFELLKEGCMQTKNNKLCCTQRISGS